MSFFRNVEETVDSFVQEKRENLEKEVAVMEEKLNALKSRPVKRKKVVLETLYGVPTVTREEEVITKEVSARAALLEKRRAHLSETLKFSEEKMAVYKECSADGVPPLAVIEKGVWEKLCAKFDLYRLEHLTINGWTRLSFSEMSFFCCGLFWSVLAECWFCF